MDNHVADHRLYRRITGRDRLEIPRFWRGLLLDVYAFAAKMGSDRFMDSRMVIGDWEHDCNSYGQLWASLRGVFDMPLIRRTTQLILASVNSEPNFGIRREL
jgi:hypothetical protein